MSCAPASQLPRPGSTAFDARHALMLKPDRSQDSNRSQRVSAEVTDLRVPTGKALGKLNGGASKDREKRQIQPSPPWKCGEQQESEAVKRDEVSGLVPRYKAMLDALKRPNHAHGAGQEGQPQQALGDGRGTEHAQHRTWLPSLRENSVHARPTRWPLWGRLLRKGRVIRVRARGSMAFADQASTDSEYPPGSSDSRPDTPARRPGWPAYQ